jgi:hypothetical protein
MISTTTAARANTTILKVVINYLPSLFYLPWFSLPAGELRQEFIDDRYERR